MKPKPKFVCVTPVEIRTGNTAPKIGTNILMTGGKLSSNDEKNAIHEAKNNSALANYPNWKFVVN